MTTSPNDVQINQLRKVTISMVRDQHPDLTARQLAVFLTVYSTEEAQTVRGLALELHVGKPVISRALDRLFDLSLIRRKHDPLDRRSILVQRTAGGTGYMRKLQKIMSNDSIATVRARAVTIGGAFNECWR